MRHRLYLCFCQRPLIRTMTVGLPSYANRAPSWLGLALSPDLPLSIGRRTQFG
jgi:hypothetical protein